MAKAIHHQRLATWLLCGFGALLGAGLGYGLRKWKDHSLSASTPSSLQTTESQLSNEKQQAKTNKLEPEAAQPSADQGFEQLLAIHRGAEPWLKLIALAETAGPNDFQHLLRLAASDSAAWRMIAARWAQRFPEHALVALKDAIDDRHRTKFGRYPSEMMDVLFESWMKSDKAAALKGLESLGDSPNGRSQVMQLAAMAFSNDPSVGLKLFSKWQVNNYGPSMTGVKKWFEKDPVKAVAETASLTRGYTNRCIMEELGKLWGTRDPKQALAMASSMEGEGLGAFEQAITKAWAAKDTKAASEAVAATQDPQRKARLGQALAESWSAKDLNAALTWIEANLTGPARAQSLGKALAKVVEKDEKAFAELLPQLPPAAQKLAVRQAIENRNAKGDAKGSEMLKWIFELPTELQSDALQESGWRLSNSEGDKKLMAEVIASKLDSSAFQQGEGAAGFIRNFASTYAASAPEEALTWVGKLPDHLRDQAMNSALNTWHESRPGQAEAYLKKMPEGLIRQQCVHDLAQSYLWKSEEGALLWLRSLTGNDQSTAREAISSVQYVQPEQQAKQKRLLAAVGAGSK